MRSTAGKYIAVVFCLLLAAVIILAVIYFSRKPTRLPAFLMKLRNRHQFRGDSVAFENPGYDREGQVGIFDWMPRRLCYCWHFSTNEDAFRFAVCRVIGD